MLIDKDSHDIIVISYPPGAGGYFLYTAITRYAQGAVHLGMPGFRFGDHGDCHHTELYIPVMWHHPDEYDLVLSKIKAQDITYNKIVVICDHGPCYDEHYQYLRSHFPQAKIVRTVLDTDMVHIVARSATEKPQSGTDMIQMHRVIYQNTQPPVPFRRWLKDMIKSPVPGGVYDSLQRWQPVYQKDVVDFSIRHFVYPEQDGVARLIEDLGMTVRDQDGLRDFCRQYQQANLKYYRWLLAWPSIRQALESGQDVDLSHITDVYDRCMIDLRIESTWNLQLPDQENWFQNTREIRRWICWP
jgi:hypothetical protein